MAQNERGASPRARCQRSRRRGEGQGRHREVGAGGSPIQRCGATNRNRIRGVGPPGTSGHGTVKSSMRGGVCLINPASTHQKFCVLLREVCMASRSKVWMKSCGTAGKPGGNSEHKPHPAAMTRTERGEISADRHAEVSRGHTRLDAGDAREAPQGRQAGQQIGGAATRTGRRPERCPERGLKERRSRLVSSEGKASVRPLELPLDDPGDEAVTGTRGEDAPVEEGG